MSALSSVFGFDPESKPPQGRLDREEEFVDISLPVAAHRRMSDGAVQVVARGTIQGTTIGIAIELAAEWVSKPIEDAPITLYWGHGRLVSIGSESDAFLALLAREYGMPAPRRMAGRIEVTMVGMNDDPSNLLDSAAKVKAFFDKGPEGHYGEVFINVDLQAGALEFRDKDAEYHAGILSSLAQSS